MVKSSLTGRLKMGNTLNEQKYQKYKKHILINSTLPVLITILISYFSIIIYFYLYQKETFQQTSVIFSIGILVAISFSFLLIIVRRKKVFQLLEVQISENYFDIITIKSKNKIDYKHIEAIKMDNNGILRIKQNIRPKEIVIMPYYKHYEKLIEILSKNFEIENENNRSRKRILFYSRAIIIAYFIVSKSLFIVPIIGIILLGVTLWSITKEIIERKITRDFFISIFFDLLVLAFITIKTFNFIKVILTI